MSLTSQYVNFLPHLLPTSHTPVKGTRKVDQSIYSAISAGWQALSRQAGIRDHRFISFNHGRDDLTTQELAQLSQNSAFIHLVHYATSADNWVHVTPRGVMVSPVATNGSSLLSLEPGSDEWTVHGTLGEWEHRDGAPVLIVPSGVPAKTARKTAKWLKGGGGRFLELGHRSPELEFFLLVNGLKGQLVKEKVLLTNHGYFRARLSR